MSIQIARDKVKQLDEMKGDSGYTPHFLEEIAELVHELDGINHVQNYIDARLNQVHSELDDMKQVLDPYGDVPSL